MATATKEEVLINQIATEASAISGITRTYGFAQNPDTLSNAQLPALLLVPKSFESSLVMHHNIRGATISVNGALFVATRSTAGGTLRYIENRAIPFLGKFRDRFRSEQTTKNLFNVGNLTKVTDFTGVYGAGGPLLTMNGVEYIGCVFTWTFREVI